MKRIELVLLILGMVLATLFVRAVTGRPKRGEKMSVGGATLVDIPLSRGRSTTSSRRGSGGGSVVSAANSSFDSWADDTFPGRPHQRYRKGEVPLDAVQPSNLSVETYEVYNPASELVPNDQEAVTRAMKDFMKDITAPQNREAKRQLESLGDSLARGAGWLPPRPADVPVGVDGAGI